MLSSRAFAMLRRERKKVITVKRTLFIFFSRIFLCFRNYKNKKEREHITKKNLSQKKQMKN